MGKYSDLAADIVQNVGGPGNINSVSNCMTRLRFDLKDESLANDQFFKTHPQLIDLIKAGGQYQVVVGPHVEDVYTEVAPLAGGTALGTITEDGAVAGVKKRRSPLQTFSQFMQGTMFPILGIMGACGIVQGILAVLQNFNIISPENTIYQLYNAAGQALFHFFPVILGFSVAKYLKMNPYFGAILGAALMFPDIQNMEGRTFFGINISGISYAGTVIPIMLICVAARPLEKWLSRKVPGVVRSFIVPLILLLIFVPIGFAIIGPLANAISNALASALTAVANFNLPVAAVLLAGLWQVMVLFGIHQAVAMVMIVDLIAGNPNPLLAYTGSSGWAFFGIAFAIWLKTRSKRMKEVAMPAWISAFFGITEPAMYGLALPRMKIFVLGCLAAAAAGLVGGLTRVTMYHLSGSGIFGFGSLVAPGVPISNLVWGLIGSAVPLLIGFISAWILYHDDPAELTDTVDGEEAKALKHGHRAEEEEQKAELHHERALALAGATTGAVASPAVAYAPNPAVAYTPTTTTAYVPATPNTAYVPATTEYAETTVTPVTPPVVVSSSPPVVQVQAPLTGRVIPLSEVNDPVFSQGMMGDGIAIVPTEGKLVAPFDGTVASIFPTGHAVGVRSADGAEVLMHIGMDTVALNGQHFKAHVVNGQQVKAGDTLVEFDIPAIEAAGYQLATPIIVTNGGEFPGLTDVAQGQIAAGQPLFGVSR